MRGGAGGGSGLLADWLGPAGEVCAILRVFCMFCVCVCVIVDYLGLVYIYHFCWWGYYCWCYH